MAVLTSLVVPSRGGRDRLPRLLAAIAAQERTPVETVVVLDGDVDDSASVLRAWHDRLDLTVVELPDNRGRSAALNAGFAAAKGDVLVRCDDDLVPSPGFAARHASHHTGEPVGVVGLPRNIFPDTAYARAFGRYWDELHRADAYALPADRHWQHWAGNVSVSRETWERVGPYDEAFRHYGWEDVDWGYRLHRAGIPVVLDPELETPHHLAAVTCETRTRRAYHSGAARDRFETKHGTRTDDGPDSAWAWAVDRVARHLTEKRAAAWGARLDRRIDRMPAPVAHKLIAFLVQSASVAGYLHSDHFETTF
jgi:GT2 family glycosyltransferase